MTDIPIPIPNRIARPLDDAELLAEVCRDLGRLRQAAWETGNRALLAVLAEIERQAAMRERRGR